MGIRDWLARFRKTEDDAAIRRAEDDMRGDSADEREVFSGDIEGLAADSLAEQGVGEPPSED